MAKVGMLALLLLNLITSALLFDSSQIHVYPKQGSIAGVFHASVSGNYAFNASVARHVCEQLGVTIADKAQVLRARTHGFETCRFGWIDEQIAVVPRIHSKPACGRGGTGIIPWRASLTTKFDVFCFSITDFEAYAQTTTTQAHKTTSGRPTPPMSQSSAGRVHLQQAKTAHLASTASWSDLHSTSSGSSRSLKPFLNYQQDKKEAQASGSTNGVVPTALVISTLFAFLLAAMVAVWYFKTNRSCMGQQQKECIETEIWDRCDIKDVNESRVEVENHSLENNSDISVTMNSDDDTESKNEEAS